MKRRQLLQYGGLGLAGFGLAACQKGNFSLPQLNLGKDKKFGEIEKKNLTIGYVADNTAIPLIIAQEQGFFEQYGLTVKLVRLNNWGEIEQNLRKWQFDAAHSLFSLPLTAQLSSNYAPIISLMMLNLNGSAIALTPKAWKEGIRPYTDFVDFGEFAHSFRKYVRTSDKGIKIATPNPYSLENYLTRYWLGAMGIETKKAVEWVTFPPQQMIYKLQAGIIDGYASSDPWNHQAIQQKAGFIPYTHRDIWQGHPGTILATMSPWVEKHPATARALVASVLEGCQYADNLEKRPEIAPIVAQKNYLNVDPTLLDPFVTGQYPYQNLEEWHKTQSIPDFTLYHYQDTNYLKEPNHANYPWRSHTIWLLTQMVRWQDQGLKSYPKNADSLIDKTYPIKVYEDVAKALNISLPSDRNKVESSNLFVDQRAFDPSQPVAYLNQFAIRANRPQYFS